MRSDEALLLDMLLAARDIVQFMDGVSEQEFQASRLIQSAVIREFQVLGEAVRLLSDEAKTRYSDIPWHVIAGMRNRLIHEYFDIRLEVVWETIQNEIPGLIEQLEHIVPPED